MDTKFDFKQVGKRMPYSTPDGFLKDMESNILEAVKNDTSQPVVVEQKKRPVLKVIWTAARLQLHRWLCSLLSIWTSLLLAPHRQTAICRL